MKLKIKYLALGSLIWLTAVGVYQSTKPLPQNISYESQWKPVKSMQFYFDTTYQNKGERIQEPQIVSQINTMIDEASNYLLLDLSLINKSPKEKKHPTLSQDLVNKLIEKRKKSPNLPILLITDPINTMYENYKLTPLHELEKNKIPVVYTNLNALRDPNPIHSSIYRTVFQWFGNSKTGYLSNPLNPSLPEVSLRSYVNYYNYKSNNRNVIINENGALTTSAELNDASSFNSSSATYVNGSILYDIWQSELAILKFSDDKLHKKWEKLIPNINDSSIANRAVESKLLTEGKNKSALLSTIKETRTGDTIDIAMSHLSDRDIISSLLEASYRRVKVRILLDPNKDDFGKSLNGLPNRPVAYEIHQNSTIPIRWYETHGEQFQSNFVVINTEKRAYVFTGSSSLSTKSINDYNLESNLLIRWNKQQNSLPSVSDWKEWEDHFNRLWNNENGTYSVSYENYADNNKWHKFLYHTGNFTGFTKY
ncbi:phospholipase D family protein [Bacillus luti]|nr:phospholipase D [Bacillus cereus]